MAKKKPTKTEELLRNSDKSLPLLDVQDLTVEFVTRRGHRARGTAHQYFRCQR